MALETLVRLAMDTMLMCLMGLQTETVVGRRHGQLPGTHPINLLLTTTPGRSPQKTQNHHDRLSFFREFLLDYLTTHLQYCSLRTYAVGMMIT